MGDRQSAVAGQFFPGDAAALSEQVATLGQAAREHIPPAPGAPMAVISPHAGYAFSGVLSAAALGHAAAARPARIVVLSPSHRHAFDGIALPSGDGFALPGMRVAIDGRTRDALVKAGLAHIEDAAHDHEHGIETQLPFLHAVCPDVPVVPLVIGQAGVDAVARVIDVLHEQDPEGTFFVLSSDLSHFLSDAAARARDAETARLIELGKAAEITPQHACGARAVAGFLASRAGRGARPLRLGMMNSAARTGDKARVVGYGAWTLHRAEADILTPHDRATLLRVARQALASRLKRGKVPEVGLKSFAPHLLTHAASFITLETGGGRLRGCIGSLNAHQPLAADVVENAVKAGFSDPRFRPLEGDELNGVRIKISVLTRAYPMEFSSQDDVLEQIVPGETGLILQEGRQRGTFLPSVWDSLTTPRDFLAGLKRKAGLPEDHWSETVKIFAYRAEAFGEPAPGV